MALGEVIRVWGAIGYQADVTFFDKMYEVGKKYEEDFAHWWTDKVQLVLHDTEKRAALYISSKKVAVEFANPDGDYSEAVRKNMAYVDGALKGLNRKKVNRFGLKTTIYTYLGLTFEELLEQVKPLCVPEIESFKGITKSDSITDIALHIDYEWKGRTVLLRVGPMQKKQGITQLGRVGDLSRLYPPVEKSTQLADFFEAVPSSFLYFDIDVVSGDKCKIQDWENFVAEGAEYTLEVFDALKKNVLGQG